MSHIERMQIELAELNEKIEKLTLFIESNGNFQLLSILQQQLMIEQLDIMNKYSKILSERINIS